MIESEVDAINAFVAENIVELVMESLGQKHPKITQMLIEKLGEYGAQGDMEESAEAIIWHATRLHFLKLVQENQALHNTIDILDKHIEKLMREKRK